MKRAVSVSIGSSNRNKKTEVQLFGETVLLERIGTDGDPRKAAGLFEELDGKVDAFGLGGTDLGLYVDGRWFPLYSSLPLIKNIRHTPLVDGNGLKSTLEGRAVKALEAQISVLPGPRRALIMAATDRWGLSHAFAQAGYECLFGDFLFSLGLPIPLYREKSIKALAQFLLPVIGRLPISWLYPVGEKQEIRTPRWSQYFQWATVIVGDCHYITRYMPDDLSGKIVVTNTTTPTDVDLFRKAGVKYLMTTTPVYEGRSFGTNMLEAGIIAAMNRKDPVDYRHAAAYLEELSRAVDTLKLTPQIREL
jgi:hypothetical protein